MQITEVSDVDDRTNSIANLHKCVATTQLVDLDTSAHVSVSANIVNHHTHALALLITLALALLLTEHWPLLQYTTFSIR